MTWTIDIPHRTRGDSIADLGTNARVLPKDDRAVIRQLALAAGQCGIRNVGDLIDIVNFWDDGERRKALDGLRRKAGLPSTSEVEHARALRQVQANISTVDPRPLQPCAAEGCTAVPRHPTTWLPEPADVKRWWCAEHRDQAAPGDMEPLAGPYRVAASGALELAPPDDGIVRAASTGAGWS